MKRFLKTVITKKAVAVFLLSVCVFSVNAQRKKMETVIPPVVETNGLTDRKFWLAEMDKMVQPMMRSLAHDSLRINMPTTFAFVGLRKKRKPKSPPFGVFTNG